MSDENKPYISADKNLPEITFKAIFLGAFLSVVLAAANSYLGLFAGMTVSASIPAAVMSMAILKLFKKHNVLENNIVQTAASAGESLAAGVIFTFPALVLMGYWANFNYWETTLIALAGGVLGVLFTIPLRSALIVKQKLTFPEGVATSEVLKSGEEGGQAVKYLALGGLMGALVKFSEAGFKIWDGVLEKAAVVGEKGYLFFSMNLSPALIAVGYIVGLRIAVLIFAGGVISWWIAIPAYVSVIGIPPDTTDLVSMGSTIWSTKIRYMGVGAMVVGGLWALISLRSAIIDAVKQGIEAFKKSKIVTKLPRTEKDTPMSWVIMGVGIMVLPVFAIYLREIEQVSISFFMAVIMVIAGFLFSAVAGYMAGIVGSSNNPISGVTIATILSASLLLLVILGEDTTKGPAAAILIGAIVACAAAIAGDNLQDLKAGHILGATPYKQQIMQMVGVVSAAMVLPLVLELLNTGYGFGAQTAENPDALAAPQATLMQGVAEGVFGGNMPWTFVFIGMGIAVLVIILDKIQESRGASFRIPVLAVAIGIYLPFELDSAIMLGGLIAWSVSYFQNKHKAEVSNYEEAESRSARTGLLFASGLITGEALIGIFLAIPVAIAGHSNTFVLFPETFGSWPGLLVIIGICYWLYYLATTLFKQK